MTPQEHTLLQSVLDNTEYVRDRVDCLDRKLTDLRVQVEHRVTKLEVRAGLVALFVSALVSVAAALTR